MHSASHSAIAATGHFVEAERLLVELPLVATETTTCKLALVNAVLAIGATMLGEGQARAE
jgi:hypothetical protein